MRMESSYTPPAATEYTGVWKDKSRARYRAQYKNETLGSFPTAVAAAVTYARVAKREAYETVPWTGRGPRDITVDEPPRPYG